VAATGAFIHARAAEVASNGGPINAEAVIAAIPRVISQIIKR
jgi:NAD(P)H-hydrate repair Nnr-like enzyme with NAD(P)H-hydrate dehydratase domain